MVKNESKIKNKLINKYILAIKYANTGNGIAVISVVYSMAFCVYDKIIAQKSTFLMKDNLKVLIIIHKKRLLLSKIKILKILCALN